MQQKPTQKARALLELIVHLSSLKFHENGLTGKIEKAKQTLKGIMPHVVHSLASFMAYLKDRAEKPYQGHYGGIYDIEPGKPQEYSML